MNMKHLKNFFYLAISIIVITQYSFAVADPVIIKLHGDSTMFYGAWGHTMSKHKCWMSANITCHITVPNSGDPIFIEPNYTTRKLKTYCACNRGEEYKCDSPEGYDGYVYPDQAIHMKGLAGSPHVYVK